MARPKNADNRYSFTCKVTGETVKTNPKQFTDLASRYNITPDELDNSYVSRAGRRVITEQKLTPDQAVAQYGIHINVANNLKCTVKTTKPVAEDVEVEVQPFESAVEVQPNDNTESESEDSTLAQEEETPTSIEQTETVDA